MTTTSFERDMEEMVSLSEASPAQKSLARHFIRSCGPLANGSRGEITAISAAIVAQTPLLLEMYLQPSVTKSELVAALEEHSRTCPQLVASATPGMQSSAVLSRDKWVNTVITVLTKMRWPGAILGIVITLRDGILQLIDLVPK